MKKRIVIMMAVLVMALTVFAGCGGGSSDSPYVGTWKAVKVSAFGEEMDAAEAEMEWTMEIKDGGECVITADGEEETCKWEENGEEGIKILFEMEEDVSYLSEEDMAMDAHLEEEQLVMNFWDMMDIYMEKQ